ncbi:uncharacterized protein LOC121479228 [Vulpes lagopus]|uniref:uncharacterized protein LOC121479228 n=1 Tax=Vulpes lagopus TaxID=494514 RepID=UPI001BC8E669|nr:uncharacterized protein LOC121479228 [Vulpes lagopus]
MAAAADPSASGTQSRQLRARARRHSTAPVALGRAQTAPGAAVSLGRARDVTRRDGLCRGRGHRRLAAGRGAGRVAWPCRSPRGPGTRVITDRPLSACPAAAGLPFATSAGPVESENGPVPPGEPLIRATCPRVSGRAAAAAGGRRGRPGPREAPAELQAPAATTGLSTAGSTETGRGGAARPRWGSRCAGPRTAQGRGRCGLGLLSVLTTAWSLIRESAIGSSRWHLQGSESAQPQHLPGSESAQPQHLPGSESAQPQHLQGSESAQPQHLPGSESAQPQHLQWRESAQPQHHLHRSESSQPQHLQWSESAQPQHLQWSESAQPQHHLHRSESSQPEHLQWSESWPTPASESESESAHHRQHHLWGSLA